MELEDRKRLLLTADRLQVYAGEKQLLYDVSAVASSGSLLAVMGPSGSGKTTFLNTVSGRMPLSKGNVCINGKAIDSATRKSFGYVTQMDIFFPVLTLRQTMEFAARVKLPSSMSSKDRKHRIQEVITSLQLDKCMDTIMGNFLMPGLSGGEKKRANVACELLPNPDVLLLDEPTSGLDSSLAMTIIELLRDWSAKEDKVVVMSIHQPSSQIFHVFDDLLLLTDGHTSYFGRQDGMVDYFESIGVPFEQHWNPADYMLEVVKQSSGNKDLIIESGSQFSDLQLIRKSTSAAEQQQISSKKSPEANGSHANAAFEGERGSDGDSTVDIPETEAADGGEIKVEFKDRSSRSRISWGRQLAALTIRGFYLARSRFLSVEPIVRTAFLGLLSSLLWFQIARKEEQIRDIVGCIFFLSTNLSFQPMMEAIMSFQEDLRVVRHERRAGMYQIGAYYTAKMLTEMPMVIVVPFVTLTIIFWSAGFGGFLQYLPFVVAILFNSLACQGIGLFIGLLTDIPKANLTIAMIIMLTSLLLGGFFAQSVPVWLVWAKYLSFVRYCFHFCFLTVFGNSPNFLCSVTQESSYPSCLNRTIVNSLNQTELPAAEILQYWPDDTLPVWGNFGIILFILVLFRIIGYLWLRFMKKA